MYFEITEFEQNGSTFTKNLVLNSDEECNIEIPTIKRFLMATLFVDTEDLAQIALYLDPVKSKEPEYPSITVTVPSKTKKYKFSIAGKYVLKSELFREYKGTIVIDENLTITSIILAKTNHQKSLIATIASLRFLIKKHLIAFLAHVSKGMEQETSFRI